jgi:hypothetical protein
VILFNSEDFVSFSLGYVRHRNRHSNYSYSSIRYFPVSNAHTLDLVERDLIAAPVVKAGRPATAIVSQSFWQIRDISDTQAEMVFALDICNTPAPFFQASPATSQNLPICEATEDKDRRPDLN